MRESKFFMTRVLAIVLLFGMTFVGCSTTYHSVEISNVRNIKEIYIRNAGETHWGINLVGRNIDISRFSDRVDVRVVDNDGIAYSKFNVPFNEAAFEVTDQHSTINPFFGLVLLLGGILILSAVIGE